LRGLLRTGRVRQAVALLDRDQMPMTEIPPQWQAIFQVTAGEVLLSCADVTRAVAAFEVAISTAEHYRLPRQIQRIQRSSRRYLPAVGELAGGALKRLSRDGDGCDLAWRGHMRLRI
jgi:hypothetical protein